MGGNGGGVLHLSIHIVDKFDRVIGITSYWRRGTCGCNDGGGNRGGRWFRLLFSVLIIVFSSDRTNGCTSGSGGQGSHPFTILTRVVLLCGCRDRRASMAKVAVLMSNWSCGGDWSRLGSCGTCGSSRQIIFRLWCLHRLELSVTLR